MLKVQRADKPAQYMVELASSRQGGVQPCLRSARLKTVDPPKGNGLGKKTKLVLGVLLQSALSCWVLPCESTALRSGLSKDMWVCQSSITHILLLLLMHVGHLLLHCQHHLQERVHLTTKRSDPMMRNQLVRMVHTWLARRLESLRGMHRSQGHKLNNSHHRLPAKCRLATDQGCVRPAKLVQVVTEEEADQVQDSDQSKGKRKSQSQG